MATLASRVTLALITCFALAQSAWADPSLATMAKGEPFEMEWLGSVSTFDVTGVSASTMPKGIVAVLVASQGWEAEKMYLVGKRIDGKFEVLGAIDCEVGFNAAKGESVTYKDGVVEMVSGIPFKAGTVASRFGWDPAKNVVTCLPEGESFEYLGDPSSEKVAKAEDMIKAGKIAEAVDILHEVEYPGSYFSEDNMCADLLMAAHPVAMKHAKTKDYKAAAEVIAAALSFYGCDPILLGPSDLLKESTKLNQILGDYGYFLVKIGDWDGAIKVNEMVTLHRPELTGAYLQLGDAYYAKKDIDRAHDAYEIYRKQMTAKGKASKIPARVLERLDEPVG